MLREDGYTYLALGLSIAGLLLLGLYAQNVQPEHISLQGITSEQIGKVVIVQARVQNVQFHSGILFFDLLDGNHFPAVYLNPELGQLALVQENAMLEVQGKVGKYKGILQIEVARVGLHG